MILELLKTVNDSYVEMKNRIHSMIANETSNLVGKYVCFQDRKYTIYAKVDNILVKSTTSIIAQISNVVMVSDNNIIIEKNPISQQFNLMNDNKIDIYSDKQSYLDDVKKACDAYYPNSL